jgi:hypothetical protein
VEKVCEKMPRHVVVFILDWRAFRRTVEALKDVKLMRDKEIERKLKKVNNISWFYVVCTVGEEGEKRDWKN